MRSPGDEAELDVAEDGRVAVAGRYRVAGAAAGPAASPAARRLKWNGESTCAGAMSSMRCQRLQPALRLARLGGLGAEALDKGMHVRDLALLLLVGRLLLRELLPRAASRTPSSCPL